MLRLFKGEFKGKLLERIDSSTPYILFGASEAGKKTLDELQKLDMSVSYFCDNDPHKWGSFIQDIKVLSPQELVDVLDGHKIIISSTYEEEIKKQLVTLGLAEYIFEGNFYDLEFTGLIMDRRRKAAEKEFKIEALKRYLNDEKSKTVLENVILYRATGDLEFLFRVAEPCEYFPDDLIRLTDEEVFIDAGAYTGDTIAAFLEKVKNQYKQIIAFEPDTNTFRRLRSCVYEITHRTGEIHNIQIHEVGLSNTTKKVNYTNNGFMHSRIEDDGTYTVEVVSLDEILGVNNEVTFIKMDIEGEEYNAILGAQELIKKYKPKLAICVYHKFDDLWEIPLLLKKLVPEYKIYLRHHGLYEPAEMYDTICYAVAD